jgi:hypothetical protein
MACGRLSGMDNGLRWYEANKDRYTMGSFLPPNSPAVVRENEDFVNFSQGWLAAMKHMGAPFHNVFLDHFKGERTILAAFRASRAYVGKVR